MVTEQQLLEQLLAKEVLDHSDKQWLLDYLDRTEDSALRALLLERFSDDLATGKRIATGQTEQLWQQIAGKTIQIQRKQPFRLRRLTPSPLWWVAAMVLLLLCAGAYLRFVNTPGASGSAAVSSVAKAVLPGRQGALLTLANGSQVQLDTLQNTTLTLEGGATATVINGELVYDSKGTEPAYNTLSTPKGRQYTVTLPDGTKVWLNSASSVQYPVAFEGKERMVKITGEVYFEVANDPAQPFRVNVNDHAEIAVLGTHFNINAYSNETHIAATLLQGSICVSPSGTVRNLSSVTLTTGQQAQLNQQTPGTIRVMNNVDLDKAVAWKNGLFNFENVTLEEIMRQLERWYDIEVMYENTIPDIPLRGEITRDVPLAELLTALKKMGLHYKLDGRRLLIGH